MAVSPLNGSGGRLTAGPTACVSAELAVPLLRVNDWLLRINDVDLINKDKKQAIKALLNGEGAINMVVRRRKSLGGKVVTPLHINLSGQKGSRPMDMAECLRWLGPFFVDRCQGCPLEYLVHRDEGPMPFKCSPCAFLAGGCLGPESCFLSV